MIILPVRLFVMNSEWVDLPIPWYALVTCMFIRCRNHYIRWLCHTSYFRKYLDKIRGILWTWLMKYVKSVSLHFLLVFVCFLIGWSGTSCSRSEGLAVYQGDCLNTQIHTSTLPVISALHGSVITFGGKNLLGVSHIERTPTLSTLWPVINLCFKLPISLLLLHVFVKLDCVICVYSATEKILQKCRQIVDMKKDDGFAPLHLAALNGHRDVTNTLLVTVSSCLIYYIPPTNRKKKLEED